MDLHVTEVKLPASELSRLPVKVLMYYWNQKKGKAIITLVLVGGILSLWRVGSIRQSYQETLISQKLDPKRPTINIDWKFVRQLIKIRRTVVPKFFCFESFYFILLPVLLFCRTYLTITMAEVISSNAQALVERQLYKFIFGVTQLGILAIPSAVVNSALKYFTSNLGVYIRRRLTLYCHENYFDPNNTFYKATQLFPKENLGEKISQDIDKFAISASDLYTNVFKTLMDLVLLSRKLSQTVGLRGPLIMFMYYILTGVFLRSFMPSFSKLCTAQQRMEETFRISHARVLNKAEEISFYRSSELEKDNLNSNFTQMIKNTFNIIRLHAIINAMDGWLTKYGATMVGYAVCAIPIFSKKFPNRSKSDLTKDFLMNIQLLIQLSGAIGQIVISYKKILNLSACTDKVDKLLNLLHNLRRSLSPQSSPSILSNLDESKQSNAPESQSANSQTNEVQPQKAVKNANDGDASKGNEKQNNNSDDEDDDDEDQSDDEDEEDKEEENIIGTKKNFGDYIRFKDVTAITRNHRVLFKNLSFTVKAGSNLLISGPPGCGKTMIFRLLSGLVPVYSGNIIKPFGGLKEIFFLPQKPYFFPGSLRDQILYPLSVKDMAANGKDDTLIFRILEQLQLSYLPKNNSLDCAGNWDQMLSDVEKQLLSVARLYYHKPRFGIIDECLNLISVEAEEKIYRTLADMSITLISVSNRRSVRQFHENFLIFDNNGNWDLSSLHQTERFNGFEFSNNASRKL